MQHRHLNHQYLTLAAIDGVISRGNWQDWVALRLAALNDSATLDDVARVCQAHIADAYAQRYHFWHHYAKVRKAA
jgi:hypothetical protein